jgi:hypothetical protein
MYSKYIYKGGGPKDHRISFLISGVPPAYKEEIPLPDGKEIYIYIHKYLGFRPSILAVGRILEFP